MTHNTKTAKLLEGLSDLYNINGINDFNQLTIEQRVYALLWCIYTNNYTSLTSHTLNNLKNTLTDLEVKLKDKIVIENIESLSIDLNELDNVNSINQILAKLTTLINKDYTYNFNSIGDLLTDIKTTKINELLNNSYVINYESLDYLADKIITKLDNVHATIHTNFITYETTLSNDTELPATLSTPVRDVSKYNTASYLITITDLTSSNLPTKVEGSINGTHWTTLPLKYSNLSGNSNHSYTISSNGSYLFSTEILTKYIRLTISNVLTAKITGQLFVK